MTDAHMFADWPAVTLAEHEAAYHPGRPCPEDEQGRCAARFPRPVPSPEDRMAAARTDTPPTTDPAPTHPGRSFRTWMSDTDRDQLDARAACAEAERDEALDARDVLRQQLDHTRTELGAAQELIAVIDDATERIDRARATYATRGQQEATTDGLGSPADRAQEPEREEVRWAYRWIGTDGQVYDEMDATDNAIETGEQRAHRIAAKRLTGTVRGEVLRYRVLTMPAEVVATYPTEARP